MSHKIPFLWDLHEFHHSPTEMTLLSKDRGALIERVFTLPIFAPISILIALLIKESLNSGFILDNVLVFVSKWLEFGASNSCLILEKKY